MFKQLKSQNSLYDYKLVSSKQFAYFLKYVRENSEVEVFEEQDKVTLFIINNYVVGFSKYYDDIKLTSYFLNSNFEYILEGLKDEKRY